jgi:quercetin dioxygenase-like cupin family protein
MNDRFAEAVLPCAELNPTLEFFTELGFRLESIFPADAPSVAVLSGFGLRVRLEPRSGNPGVLRLAGEGAPRTLSAPNGTRVEIVSASPALEIPPPQPQLIVSRACEAAHQPGRAGMSYRDLLPGRWGGRFIVSQIRIQEGGPVPDYVHFHEVAVQVICCVAGWVRVVYEDQGPPLTLRAGDCVLQPPRIRHRVLECSPGLEVIELGCPAQHVTLVEHGMTLPTESLDPQRDFGGQRFVHHVARGASWAPWRLEGFESRDTGVATATGGLASVRFARAASAPAQRVTHDAEFLLHYVVGGSVTLDCEGLHPLEAGDAFAVPAGLAHTLADARDLELLELALPASFRTLHH